jgi:hypothetical protein
VRRRELLVVTQVIRESAFTKTPHRSLNIASDRSRSIKRPRTADQTEGNDFAEGEAAWALAAEVKNLLTPTPEAQKDVADLFYLFSARRNQGNSDNVAWSDDIDDIYS